AVLEELGVAVIDATVHGFRHRRGRHAQALDEPGADRQRAFLLELEDGLEVLLGGVMPLGHGPLLGPLSAPGALWRRGRTSRRPPQRLTARRGTRLAVVRLSGSALGGGGADRAEDNSRSRIFRRLPIAA